MFQPSLEEVREHPYSEVGYDKSKVEFSDIY